MFPCKRGIVSPSKNASGRVEAALQPAEGLVVCVSQHLPQRCRLIALGVPLSAQAILSFSSTLVSMAFIGHLGKHDLSAAVLGTSLFNVTGLSILIGLCSAMETLCGQVLALLS